MAHPAVVVVVAEEFPVAKAGKDEMGGFAPVVEAAFQGVADGAEKADVVVETAAVVVVTRSKRDKNVGG